MRVRHISFIPVCSLQLFADGGAGDGGTAQGSGVTAEAAAQQNQGAKNPLANVRYGIQPEEAPAAGVQETAEEAPDLNAEFEALIKGKYKQQYDARTQDTIQKRLRSSKETVDKYNALSPALELLGRKYGVDASDPAALVKAIEADSTILEEEAMKRGLTVDQYREIRAMEKENAELKRQMQERQTRENADRLYASWMTQAQEAQKVYPSLDLRTEMANPKFVELLRSNIDVRTAYEVIHKDEIIHGAMQFTAKTVESKLAKKIASGGARPAENGSGATSTAVVRSDVSRLTKADREEIRKRVARGEKIRF